MGEKLGTPFRDVYMRFLSNVDEFDIAEMTDVEIDYYCFDYLMSALVISKPIEKTFEYNIQKKCFLDNLLNVEIEILALNMIAKWYENQANSSKLTRQFIGTKDEKFFSQKNHADGLFERARYYKGEARRVRNAYLVNNHFDDIISKTATSDRYRRQK